MTESDALDLFKKQLTNLAKRRLKATKKYLAKCELQLSEAQNWPTRQQETELLNAYQHLLKRGMKEITLSDWNVTLKLDPALTPHQEIAKRFKKCKKLRLSVEPLKAQHEKTLQALLSCEELLPLLEAAETEEALKQLQERYQLPQPQSPQKPGQPKEPPKPYLEFFSAAGIPIWVGKNAKGNDALTFRHAHGNDTWMHVADYPGSHVVIRSNQEVDEETLQDALQLALSYSKAKTSGKAEVCVTHKKFVTRIGSSEGKVQVAKQKIVWVVLDENRLERLNLNTKAQRH